MTDDKIENITINPNTKVGYAIDENTQKIEVSTLVAKTYNELLKRFIESNWNKLELTMKNGDTVLIKRYIPPFGLNWFVIEIDGKALMGTDKLIEIAANICNYEELVKSHAHKTA